MLVRQLGLTLGLHFYVYINKRYKYDTSNLCKVTYITIYINNMLYVYIHVAVYYIWVLS